MGIYHSILPRPLQLMAQSTSKKNGEYFEGLSRENHEYYEVLFPGKFTQKHPWGSLPEADWSKHYPVSLLGADTRKIPIYSLSHITHNKQAEKISSTLSEGHYTFIPKAKLGKATGQWDGTPIGETYREVGDNQYLKIPRSEDNPVFPGYLSWWGIDVREWYETVTGKEFLELVNDERREGFYVPGYLSQPTNSMYGNNALSISTIDLLNTYERARKDKESSKIQLKVGGTLRYEKEICYVVMVGMEGDKELESMPNIGENQHFKNNGLVDEQGVVVDKMKTPEFEAHWLIKKMLDHQNMEKKYTNFSWEQLVFAFYFPKPDQQIICSEQSITKSSVVHSMCVSTTPIPNKTKWECPNELNK